MKFFKSGFFLTLILSLIVLEVFYGKLLNHCNTVYFADWGDTFQAYYNSLYHITYDKSYFHNAGMNYPYGENIFFTGGHLPIVTLLKLINTVINTSAYTVGIINLAMLLSIVVCALSIYLIFKELSLPPVYSSFAAVGIAFLSPQMQRLGGTLSYEFFIPVFMYLLMKFYQNPSVKKSIVIGGFIFLGITTHMYLFLFFCFLALFYWTILFFSRETNFSNIRFVIKHFFLQMIVPYLLLNILLYLTDSVNDRTQYPWGFFEYLSSWAGVFFPYGKPYQNIVGHLYTPAQPPGWEGIAYIGAFAVCSFIALIVAFFLKILHGKFRELLAVTDKKILNIFFWASIAALLYSFGYPFIWNKSVFVHYIGPLKELRTLGRFSWLFFYVMNIIAFYNLYQWLRNKNKILRYGLILVCFTLFSVDVYSFINNQQNTLDTHIKELADTQNNLPENNWLKHINIHQFQAIIPLPYFHVGSENVWIYSNLDILKYVFIVSLKTGLPTTAVWSSRTSLSQTYKNIELILEPYRPLQYINDLPDEKPFLVMAQPDKINKMEKYLLSKCKFLLQTPDYSLYKLSYSTLQHYTDSLYINTEKEFRKAKTYPIDNFYSTDSIKNFIHYDYEDQPNPISYNGKGAYTGNYSNYNVLYEGTIPDYKDSNYIFSFWMYDFTTDLYPRGTVEVALRDSTGKLYKMDYTGPLHMLKALDGKWALLEQEVKIKHASDKIKITLWNTDVEKGKKVVIDEFWLKPASTDIYRETANYIFKNNRYYKLQN